MESEATSERTKAAQVGQNHFPIWNLVQINCVCNHEFRGDCFLLVDAGWMVRCQAMVPRAGLS